MKDYFLVLSSKNVNEINSTTNGGIVSAKGLMSQPCAFVAAVVAFKGGMREKMLGTLLRQAF